MRIIKQNRSNISVILDTLEKGGLVIMATETLYGAMVDATNDNAVEKLCQYKNRPFGKPYSVAVSDYHMAEKYVHINKAAKNLYRTFLPGPVTIISKGKNKLAKGVESEDKTLGIRIPDYPFLIDVIKMYKKPLTATSANASYKKRPYKISDILSNLSNKQKSLISLIVDAGELPKNEPSTVIDTTIDDGAVLRQGEIKFDNKNEILSKSEEDTKNVAKELWQKHEKYHGKRAIIFALEGPMGSGKTVFTKGLAKAIGIKDKVVSPTYNLEEEYDQGKLIHLDAWRIKSNIELSDLGFSKRISDKSIISIEWADRVTDIIRSKNEEAIIIWAKIKYSRSDNHRLISWKNL